MKNLYLVLATLLSLSFSQSLSNAELDLLKEQFKSQSRDINQLDSDLSGGQSQKLNSNIDVEKFNVDESIAESNDIKSDYFGYNYFNAPLNFYDNVPVSNDYVLGPGDEIIISLWGETNSREKIVIDKNGLIYYENIGFINISNKTVNEAEKILKDTLSNVYSTMQQDQPTTDLMLEVGRIKSINVFFSGYVNSPGLKVIHPSSDLFTALVQIGGINKLGSLRNVQLIRNGKIIDTTDFYSFFLDGKNEFSKIKILDGDIIHIPPVRKRVSIRGSVNNDGLYELKESDSFNILLSFAGGLTEDSSSSTFVDLVIPISRRLSDDIPRDIKNLSLDDAKDLKLNNGDKVYIYSFNENVRSVDVFGSVKKPGNYPISENENLKTILDLAGGFEDPDFLKNLYSDVLILRGNESDLISEEFKVSYNESNNFKLQRGDKILVYRNTKYDIKVVQIKGSVNKEGTYLFKEGMTISDLINLAGGYLSLASKENLTLNRKIENSETSQKVFNINKDSELFPGDELIIYDKTNIIQVSGNVYNPGSFIMSKNNSVKSYIELAGGFKKLTNKSDIYILSIDGASKKTNFINRSFMKLKDGDKIIIPTKEIREDFRLDSFLSNIASTMANIALIVSVLNNSD